MQQKFIKNINFNITKEQIEKIRPYLPEVDELLMGRLSDFQEELNDAIVMHLDLDYEDTPISLMLQKVYDEIYYQN